MVFGVDFEVFGIDFEVIIINITQTWQNSNVNTISKVNLANTKILAVK